MSLDPVDVMVAIDSDAALLDQASKDLYDSIRAVATAEREYEHARSVKLIELMDEYRQAGERLPAEDLRNALVHKRIDKRLYGDWLSAKARADALRASTRAKENALSARQSLLSTLREEARVG